MDNYWRTTVSISRPSNGVFDGWMKVIRRVGDEAIEHAQGRMHGIGGIYSVLEGYYLRTGMETLDVGRVVVKCVPIMNCKQFDPEYVFGVGTVGWSEIEWLRGSEGHTRYWTLGEIRDFLETVRDLLGRRDEFRQERRNEMIEKVRHLVRWHGLTAEELDLWPDG